MSQIECCHFRHFFFLPMTSRQLQRELVMALSRDLRRHDGCMAGWRLHVDGVLVCESVCVLLAGGVRVVACTSEPVWQWTELAVNDSR